MLDRWFGNKVAVQEAAVLEEEYVEQRVCSEEPIEVPAFGARVGKLTQFGSQWIDVSRIIAIDFDPVDGCGAELQLDAGGGDTVWHLCDEDAAALSAWMQMQQEATT